MTTIDKNVCFSDSSFNCYNAFIIFDFFCDEHVVFKSMKSFQVKHALHFFFSNSFQKINYITDLNYNYF